METSTITITERHECLPFSELSEAVQEKVLQEYINWNVDHDWWDSVYSWFEEHCESYGITVDTDNIAFSGFWSQGDGAAFAGSVTDIDKFLDAFEIAFTVNRSTLMFSKQAKRLIRYMFHERGLRLVAYRSQSFHINQSYHFDRYGVNPHEGMGEKQEHFYNTAEMVLDTLESIWEEACTDLAYELYRTLEREYDYLTSREALEETFEANECIFDIHTGELFYRQDAKTAA